MTTRKTTTDNGNSKRPSHRVTYQTRFKDGKYGQQVDLGGAWQNKAGGISFSFGGGQITIWPNDRDDNGGGEAR